MRDFVFCFDGVDYRLGDLTLAEAEDLEATLGIQWGELAPIGVARHRLACMAVFLRRTRTEDDVAKLLADITLNASYDMWRLDADDLPSEYSDGVPLAEAGASTPT